ncbi:MAG: ComEC family competence protein [Rickettsiaceae bacterium]|nr:MAG: ComEC family competence protein [Rickettsiaceae bacterium]
MLLKIFLSFKDHIQTQLFAEYQNLSLWYFAGGISGIIFYFDTAIEISNFLLVSVFIVILAISIGFRKNIILQFSLNLIISFIIGIAISKYRADNLNTIMIKNSYISEVKGKIESIKPIIDGVQVIIKDVTVKKSLHELQKVKITIASQYYQEMSIDDDIKITAKLSPPLDSMMPGGYDFKFHAYFAQISATGYAKAAPIITKANKPKLKIHIYQVRKFIYDRLINTLGDLVGNFAAAILIGETVGIDKQVMKNMRNSGISHILCASGLHLSLVAITLFISSRFILNLSNFIVYKFDIKIIAAVSSIIGSYVYLEISGKQIAATRAFIMTATSITAMILSRRANPLRSIGIAAAIILVMNPEYILQPSFQLSFIAVFSLISGYQFHLKNSWVVGNAKGIFASIKLYVLSNVYSSFLASVLTAPIVISHFYIFSTYSIMMNLIAVPIMSFFLMPLAIIAVILMPMGLEKWPLEGLGFFIQIIIESANFANQMPNSVWYFGYITPMSLVVYMLGFLFLCLWQNTLWRTFGLLIMLVSCVLMNYSPKPDLIFDARTRALAIKNSQQQLIIYSSGHIPSFQSNYWANWFGQEKAEILPMNKYFFVTNAGKTVAINLDNNFCTTADVQMNIGIKARCPAVELELSHEFLANTGIVAIFCNKKNCFIKKTKNN